jgi:integrase
MSVYLAKRKDGTLKSPYYQFDFVLKVNGERRQVHGSTNERKEKAAREFEKREKARLKAERPLDTMTLAAGCTRYEEEVGQFRASSDDIDKAYEHCCRLIGGARIMINITAEDIATAVRKRCAETYGSKNPKLVTPATVNRQIVEPMMRLFRRARSVWNMSCEPDRIDWKALKMKEPEGRNREFTSEESDAFWSTLRQDYHPIILFLAGRGFRARSAIGMKKFDVDLKNGTANVWKKGVGMTKMRLARDQCNLVLASMKLCPNSPFIWTYVKQKGVDKGKRFPVTYSGLRGAINTAFRQSGITDFKIHDLRYDFASKLLRRTSNLALVKDALAHNDIKSTLRYAHVLGDDIVRGMEGMTTGMVPKQALSVINGKKAAN